MPVLEKIVIQDFRNIELQELGFSPNVNCICGGNGEGKTNLLEAIHYLSMTKSSSGSSDRFNFRHGCQSFSISGIYDLPMGPKARFSIMADADGNKKMKREDKVYDRISSHIGVLPIVMVSPSDTSLVSESGEERRRFVNAVLSQMDSGYLSSIQQYNRILAQRNKLLKEGEEDSALMDTYDALLSQFSVPIHRSRCEFVSRILPVIQRYYSEISSGKETVSVQYRTDMEKGPLEETLKASRQRDIYLKYTSAGIQRDDFIFTMDGFPIRKFGSQGQQKSFLVALKFAQYEIMNEKTDAKPILLLDDLFDKLDMGRVSNLLKMVAGNGFGQIFISDSNKVRTASVIDSITDDRTFLEAESGTFRKIDG